MAITTVNGVIQASDLLTIFPKLPISNHPSFTNYTRKVELLGEGFTRMANQTNVTMNALITHYDPNGNYCPQTIGDVIVSITADLSYYVDTAQQGYPHATPLTADAETGEFPSGSITGTDGNTYVSTAVRAWDAWVLFFYNNPEQLFTVMTQQLQAEDSFGNYDSSIYPQGQKIPTI